jgi:hypothetical protein
VISVFFSVYNLRRHFLSIGTLVLIVTSGTLAQDYSPQWEKYLELGDDIEDQTELIEQLEDWLANPLDLNKATQADMLMIPGFPLPAARQILKQRKQGRTIVSLEQAKQTLGVDEDLWQWISQFIMVKLPEIRKPLELAGDIRLRWSRPTELSRGFEEDKFVGGPAKFYQRYRLRMPGSIQIGGLLEKDGGESSLADHRVFGLEKQWGPDGPRVVVGNYTLSLGSGLMLWSPFSTRKGSAAFYTARRSSRTIRPYLSSYEADYFQGAAFESRRGSWQFGGWYSDANIDASRTDSGELSSIIRSGLHRTGTERKKRAEARIRMLGGFLGYELRFGVDLQFTGFQARFQPGVAVSSDEPGGFGLSGENLRVLGVNARGSVEHFSYFGEAVWNENGAVAFVISGMRQWQKLKLLGLYRNYSPRYENPYAHGFGERDGTQNEKGWYLASEYRPFKSSTFTAWFDHFSTPWRTFGTPLPERGSDFFLQWDQKVNTSFRFYLRYTNDMKSSTTRIPAESALYERVILPYARERMRLHVQFRLQRDYEMAGRMETVGYGLAPEANESIPRRIDRGWVLYWELRKSRPRNGLRGGVRLTFFDTESFDARLYQFEQDLPGVLTNKLLSGRGVRFYVFVRSQILKHFTVSAKYASTRFEDRGHDWQRFGYHSFSGPA